MGALCESVDACIGSSGPMNADRLASDTLKRALDMNLNCVAMGLTLPSRKSFPVVGDNHFQPSRHGNLTIVISDHRSLPYLTLAVDRDIPAKSSAPPLDRYKRGCRAFFYRRHAGPYALQHWSASRPMWPPGMEGSPAIFLRT